MKRLFKGGEILEKISNYNKLYSLLIEINEIMQEGTGKKLEETKIERAKDIFKTLKSEKTDQEYRQLVEVLEEKFGEIQKQETSKGTVAHILGDEIHETNKEMGEKDWESLDEKNKIILAFKELLYGEKEQDLNVLLEFNDKEKICQIMGDLTSRIIRLIYEENKFIIRENINDTWIHNLIQEGKQTFPTLGNNKFINTPKKYRAELENHCTEKIFTTIREKTISTLKTFRSKFADSRDIIEEVAGLVVDLFEKGIIKNIFEGISRDFYMNQRETANERKNTPNKKEGGKKSQTLVQKIENNIEQEEKEGQEIQTIENWVEEHMPNNIRQKEITKYILRLYRKHKGIRIIDMRYRFNLSEEIFSEEMINESKRIGIHLINGVHKEKTSEDKETDPEQWQEDKKAGDNTTEPCLKDKIIQELKSNYINTGEGWSKLFQKAGYRIDNEKNFIKQFNKIYKTEKQKQLFHQDMSEHIFTIETKTNGANGQSYRSIDLEENNRILFIQKGSIDGIYNHNDYMRRLNNLGKGK